MKITLLLAQSKEQQILPVLVSEPDDNKFMYDCLKSIQLLTLHHFNIFHRLLKEEMQDAYWDAVRYIPLE